MNPSSPAHPVSAPSARVRARVRWRGLFAGVLGLCLPVLAQAANLVVNSNADPVGFNPNITIATLGPVVTLRDAINAANNTGGTNVITFDPSLNGGTITLQARAPITISSSLSINGPGADILTLASLGVVEGTGYYNMVHSYDTVEISGLRFDTSTIGPLAPLETPLSRALIQSSASLTVRDCNFFGATGVISQFGG